MTAKKSFEQPLGLDRMSRDSDYGSISSEENHVGEECAALFGEDGNASCSNDSMQQGVREVEAISSILGKRALTVAYLSVFLVFLGNSLEQQATGNLASYVTSDFSQHGLVSTVSIMSNIIGGVARVPIAKLIDIWGRGEGYVAMVACTAFGLILMALCNNIATYAAAQVFYWLGFDGIAYVLHVFLADTSSLQNRAMVFAFSSTPYIITTFLGPAVAQWFYEFSSWRWAFIVFAVTTPLISSPMIGVFFLGKSRAKRQHAMNTTSSEKESFKHFMSEFDGIGTVLFVIGMAFVLLPISLRSYEDGGWKSPLVMLELLIGYGSLCSFVVWEYKYAPVKLIPFHIFRNKTVLGACLLSAALLVSFNIFNAYFLAFLQVVHNQSIRDAGYIANIFNVVSCVLGLAIGWLIRVSGRFRWIALIALPLRILGTGYMIYAVQPDTPLSTIIACQLMNAVSGATLVVCEQTAVMAAVSHAHVAVALAVMMLFSSIGGSVGTAVSGALWSSTLPGLLREYLPDSAKGDADKIYGDLKKALSYPVGSPERTAIAMAYSATQQKLFVIASAVLPFSILFVLMWKDLPVKDEAKSDKTQDSHHD